MTILATVAGHHWEICFVNCLQCVDEFEKMFGDLKINLSKQNSMHELLICMYASM